MEKNQKILKLFEDIIPFRFLSNEIKKDLLKEITEHRFSKGDIVFSPGDTDKRIYLIYKGLIESFDKFNFPERRLHTIRSKHYFGDRSSLFDRPRKHLFRTAEETLCYSITGARFLKLVKESKAFAQAYGNILRDKQGIFSAFEKFITELMQQASKGQIEISSIVKLYKVLQPALHSKVNINNQIDYDALIYAVRRLPSNVTSTFAYILTDDLHANFNKPDKLFKKIESKARRRDTWEMLPGQSMILLRTGFTDLIDFVSCLCLYNVEVHKIRSRFADSKLIQKIINLLKDQVSKKSFFEIMTEAGFSNNEIENFIKIWPENPLNRIKQIAFHRETFTIETKKQVDNYNSRRTELWTSQVGDATKALLGCFPSYLPEDIKVHIISSNAHSVSNCLTPYFVNNADEIIRWHNSHSEQETWHNKYDQIYHAARDYFHHHPDKKINEQTLLNWGIIHLKETASTGIQVQLIDTSKLKNYEIDPNVSKISNTSKLLIVNIDYAFGEQAEDIMRNLLMLFGKNLASINILGKAGSLIGNRGDIIIPDGFIEQSSDHFYPLLKDYKYNKKRLESRLINRNIFEGNMLTVSGTLIQNKRMLNFYKNIWNCSGLEMEGTYYFKQIQESSQLGVINKDIPLRFFYYVSDLPLHSGSTLSSTLKASEGIPPLYAITREILSEILDQEKREKNEKDINN